MTTIQDCILFANENPICSLATVENDQPKVRIMGFWFADETGFYFQTSKKKQLYDQILINPNVEACFYKLSGMIGTMLRVSGKADLLDDYELKKRVIEERPFLKGFGLTPESPGLIVFRITHGEAHLWTMENNLVPKEMIHF